MPTLATSQPLSFGTATANWPSRPRWVSLWRNGVFQDRAQISPTPPNVMATDAVTMAAGTITFTMTGPFSDRLLTPAAIGSDLEVRLHSNNPGSNGTANAISGRGYHHSPAGVLVAV